MADPEPYQVLRHWVLPKVRDSEPPKCVVPLPFETQFFEERIEIPVHYILAGHRTTGSSGEKKPGRAPADEPVKHGGERGVQVYEAEARPRLRGTYLTPVRTVLDFECAPVMRYQFDPYPKRLPNAQAASRFEGVEHPVITESALSRTPQVAHEFQNGPKGDTEWWKPLLRRLAGQMPPDFTVSSSCCALGVPAFEFEQHWVEQQVIRDAGDESGFGNRGHEDGGAAPAPTPSTFRPCFWVQVGCRQMGYF